MEITKLQKQFEIRLSLHLLRIYQSMLTIFFILNTPPLENKLK